MHERYFCKSLFNIVICILSLVCWIIVLPDRKISFLSIIWFIPMKLLVKLAKTHIFTFLTSCNFCLEIITQKTSFTTHHHFESMHESCVTKTESNINFAFNPCDLGVFVAYLLTKTYQTMRVGQSFYISMQNNITQVPHTLNTSVMEDVLFIWKHG